MTPAEKEESKSYIYFGLTNAQKEEAERRARAVTWVIDFTVRRDVMFKKYILGKTFAEIGREHGISTCRVADIYHKTCIRLELMLSDDIISYTKRNLNPYPHNPDFSDLQSLIDGIWFHYPTPHAVSEYRLKARTKGSKTRQLLNSDVFMSLDEPLE
jgi:hypothetical protein